jgi:hypothetical protein
MIAVFGLLEAPGTIGARNSVLRPCLSRAYVRERQMTGSNRTQSTLDRLESDPIRCSQTIDSNLAIMREQDGVGSDDQTWPGQNDKARLFAKHW